MQGSGWGKYTAGFGLRLCLLAISCCMGGATTCVHAQVPGALSPDWNALSSDAVRLLTEYIRIDTTNPPGNELEGLKFLKRVLDREGIDAEILDTAEVGSGRGNLYARLRGNGGKLAFAVVHHVDVGPVDRRSWTVDPFAGVVKDGYVWGRGAL